MVFNQFGLVKSKWVLDIDRPELDHFMLKMRQLWPIIKRCEILTLSFSGRGTFNTCL